MATKFQRMSTTVPPSPAQPRAGGGQIPYGIYGGAGEQPVVTEFTETSLVYEPALPLALRSGQDLIPQGLVNTEGWYGINLKLILRVPEIAPGQWANSNLFLQVRTGSVTGFDFSNGLIAEGAPLCGLDLGTTFVNDTDAFPTVPPFQSPLYETATGTAFLVKGTRLGLYLVGGGGQLFAGGDPDDVNNYIFPYAVPYDWQVEYFLMAAATAETFDPPPPSEVTGVFP